MYFLVNHIVVIKTVINHLIDVSNINLNPLLKNMKIMCYMQYILYKYYIGLYKISKYSKL